MIEVRAGMNLNRIFLLVMLGILTSCSNQESAYISFPRDIKRQIKSTDLIINQPEGLKVEDYEAPSDAITSFFKNVFTKSATDKKHLGFLNILDETFKSIPLTSLMKKHFIDSIKSVTWLGFNKVTFMNDKEVNEKMDKIIGSSSSDAVMFLKFTHGFRPSFEYLVGVVTVEVYGVSEALKQLGKARKSGLLYRTHLCAVERVPRISSQATENAKAWVGGNNILQNSIVEILKEAAYITKRRLINLNHI